LSKTPGPVRNRIAEPDRRYDDLAPWVPDFNRAYYQHLLFSDAPGVQSMRNFYLELSSNRYTVHGEVSDWVKVPGNEAVYGANTCGSIVCSRTWLFIRDSANAWYNAQIAAGKTKAAINEYLSQFDTWDRYDYDNDGNFNEPDGYIDHFLSLHAGQSEESGTAAEGTDAIWSHRWYAYYNLIGSAGPAFNRLGGVRIGQSDYWIGDYTIQGEDAPLGLVAHEFGHDLGLPDLYDQSVNFDSNAVNNSTGFWTLYSYGLYGSDGHDALGTKPIHMSAYEKIFLGWSNYQTVQYGEHAAVKLGPAEASTKQAQQLILLLPDKELDSFVGPPYGGSHYYFAGGNDFDNSMTRSVALPAGTPTLTAKVRLDMNSDWDYAYLTVNGTHVATSLSTPWNPKGQNAGNGITGYTGADWVDLSADLSAFAGQIVTLGFRYVTGTNPPGNGFSVDDIAISGLPIDDAELDPGWIFTGFTRTDGSVTLKYFNAYYAEYRQYIGNDDALRTGPYNFGSFSDPAKYNLAVFYPYQEGLLVWYYDTSFSDNNVSDHCTDGRCGGLVLPVDAHPDPLIGIDGRVWFPAFQSYDSPFGLRATDAFCIDWRGTPLCYGGLPGNPEFNDTRSYWTPPDPTIGSRGLASVPTPVTGTRILVVGTSAHDQFMQVIVN
jgi:immune inhibitor A